MFSFVYFYRFLTALDFIYHDKGNIRGVVDEGRSSFSSARKHDSIFFLRQECQLAGRSSIFKGHQV